MERAALLSYACAEEAGSGRTDTLRQHPGRQAQRVSFLAHQDYLSRRRRSACDHLCAMYTWTTRDLDASPPFARRREPRGGVLRACSRARFGAGAVDRLAAGEAVWSEREVGGRRAGDLAARRRRCRARERCAATAQLPPGRVGHPVGRALFYLTLATRHQHRRRYQDRLGLCANDGACPSASRCWRECSPAAPDPRGGV